MAGFFSSPWDWRGSPLGEWLTGAVFMGLMTWAVFVADMAWWSRTLVVLLDLIVIEWGGEMLLAYRDGTDMFTGLARRRQQRRHPDTRREKR